MQQPDATRLRELREARGLKRANLAVRFDVDPSTIFRWEQVGPPKERLVEVADYFEVSVPQLMGWEKEAA